MITPQKVAEALASREALVAEIRSYGGPGMDFQQCLQLCGTKLKEQYLAANRVVCLLEDSAINSGRALRLKAGGLEWHRRAAQ